MVIVKGVPKLRMKINLHQYRNRVTMYRPRAMIVKLIFLRIRTSNLGSTKSRAKWKL